MTWRPHALGAFTARRSSSRKSYFTSSHSNSILPTQAFHHFKEVPNMQATRTTTALPKLQYTEATRTFTTLPNPLSRELMPSRPHNPLSSPNMERTSRFTRNDLPLKENSQLQNTRLSPTKESAKTSTTNRAKPPIMLHLKDLNFPKVKTQSAASLSPVRYDGNTSPPSQPTGS